MTRKQAKNYDEHKMNYPSIKEVFIMGAGKHTGTGFFLIVVLFILLIIVGAGGYGTGY